MNVLSIGSDRALFDPESSVRARQKVFAEKIGNLSIIVFSTQRLESVQEGSLKVQATNSMFRSLYGLNTFLIARSIPTDIVTVQDPFETGLIGYVIAWYKKVPLHVQIHTDPFSQYFVRRSFLNRVRRHIARFVLSRADAIRVVSERVAESLSKRGYSIPTTVLPVFTDISRFESLPRLKHPRFKIAFLFIGRLEKEKGCDEALKAVAYVRARGHDAGLTIVGSGREENSLRELAHTLQIEQHVIFANWQKDVTHYLSEADALLVPSLYEGYAIVIVEALAAHVPVLATDVGVAREAGALVISGDFSHAVLEWTEKGSRGADLQLPLARSFDEYADAWANDIRECVVEKKG